MFNFKKPALQTAERDSFHQGTVRFQNQDQACLQDCAYISHEEDENAKVVHVLAMKKMKDDAMNWLQYLVALVEDTPNSSLISAIQ